MNKSEIQIFTTIDGTTEIEVQLDNETVWLNQYQLESLFETNRTSINRHISNIYKSEELEENSTCAKIAQVQKEGGRKIKRNIKYYNLDLIIAVGYRVNSKRGTEFRIWANKILKDYLIKGYSINEKRLTKQNEQLKELRESVKILGNIVNQKELTSGESVGLLKIISDYAFALDILDQYDYQTRIDVRLKDETGWLSQAQMAELFQPTKLNVSLHIRNIFKEDELNEISVVKESLTAQPEGKREVQRNMKNTLNRIRTEDAQIMKELEEGLKNLQNKKQNN